MSDTEHITDLVEGARAGDDAAVDELVPVLYGELRSLAGHYMRRERVNHTLQPTALVHEAFMRLVDQRRIDSESRAHFLALAATTMRRVLVDHARAHKAEKRGGGNKVTLLVEMTGKGRERTLDLIALDNALDRLSGIADRAARVVELRFFGGLSVVEVAQTLEVSTPTVKRDWRFARAWLARELAAAEPT